MSALTLRRVLGLLGLALRAGIAALLAVPVVAAPAAPGIPAPESDTSSLPTSVLALQRQHERWITAFNGWRGAKWVWPGETTREAELRSQTRLLIVRLTIPWVAWVGAQRRAEGSGVIISAGLIALVDELPLAETVRSKGECPRCCSF